MATLFFRFVIASCECVLGVGVCRRRRRRRRRRRLDFNFWVSRGWFGIFHLGVHRFD